MEHSISIGDGDRIQRNPGREARADLSELAVRHDEARRRRRRRRRFRGGGHLDSGHYIVPQQRAERRFSTERLNLSCNSFVLSKKQKGGEEARETHDVHHSVMNMRFSGPTNRGLVAT